MQKSRSASNTVVRVAAIKFGRLQMLPGSQSIAEVEAIGTASDTDLLSLILLDTDLPRPAPSQRTKPDVTMVLIV